MEMLGFAAVPAITIICYLGAEIFKQVAKDSLSAIPALCGALGGVLGAVSFIYAPGYIPADNIIVAVATGIISGFASTGVNQMLYRLGLLGDTNHG